MMQRSPLFSPSILQQKNVKRKIDVTGIMSARHAKVIPVAGVSLISQSAAFADFPAVMKNCVCACSIS